MKAIKSWTISDEFWERGKPLISKPKRDMKHKYMRRPGVGKSPWIGGKCLRPSCMFYGQDAQWRALPKAEFGSASSVHKYFLEWKKKGVFVKLWCKGLAEYDEMEGIVGHGRALMEPWSGLR